MGLLAVKGGKQGFVDMGGIGEPWSSVPNGASSCISLGLTCEVKEKEGPDET